MAATCSVTEELTRPDVLEVGEGGFARDHFVFMQLCCAGGAAAECALPFSRCFRIMLGHSFSPSCRESARFDRQVHCRTEPAI